MKVFGLILVLAVLASGERRDKRTLGTIFQFFGFRLVPLTESEMKGSFSEKYQFPAQTARNPKFMRIQTVMPIIEKLVESASASPTTQRLMFSTSSETPTTSRAISSTTTTQIPTTSTAIPTTNARIISPLRIILPDFTPTFPDFSLPTSSESPTQLFIKTSSESVTENMKMISTTQAPLTVTEATISSVASSLPSVASSSLPSSSEILSTTETISNEINNQFSTSNEINQLFSSPFETFQTSGNFASLPLSSSPVQSFESPPEFRANHDFEFYQSNDVSNSFFNPNSFNTFGIFPKNLMPPRPFALPSTNNDANRLSSSSASMNMNGQKFNYLTFHN